MQKPTEDKLRQNTQRLGRIFVFEFPTYYPGKPEKGRHWPDDERPIVNAVLDIPGVTGISGPSSSGYMTIMVDDSIEGVHDISDDAFCDTVAHIISENWKE